MRDLAGLCASIALLACICAAPAGAIAAEGKPFGIASFSVQSTRTREVAHGPGIPGYGFIEEPYAFTQAAGHPYALTSEVEFATEEVGESHTIVPTRDPKDVVIDLPHGLVADAQAAPRCSLAQLLGGIECPPDTQVGVVVLHLGGVGILGPIVNLTPERGVAAELGLETGSGFSFLLTGHLVRTAQGYGLAILAGGLPMLGVTDLQVTLWGVPGDESHDPQRGLFCTASGANQSWACTGGGLPYGVPQAPFLTMPAACSAGPVTAGVRADSWEEPGRYVQAHSTLPGMSKCELLRFDPEIEVRPDTLLADEPVGLDVDIEVPQTQSTQAAATPPLRDATVTLPQGVSITPGVADGLRGCPATGPEGIDIPTGLNASGEELEPGEVGEGEEVGPNGEPRLAPGHCPEASTIGSAEALTPLLASPIKGRVYLATPGCGGPGQGSCSEEDAVDGNLYRLYVELGGSGEPDEGVNIKLEGRVQANPATGQLTVKLMDIPQLPLSRLRIDLYGGPRALLDSPATCGPATTTSDLQAWSATGSTPEGLLDAGTPDANPSSFYEVTGCAGAGAFSPGFIAGTLDAARGRLQRVHAQRHEGRPRTVSGRDPGADPAGTLGDAVEHAAVRSGAGRSRELPGNLEDRLDARRRRRGVAPAADGRERVPDGRVQGRAVRLEHRAGRRRGAADLGRIVVRARLDIDPKPPR